MKKVALTVAVLALGLAACGTKTENAVDNAGVENAAANDLDAAVDNAADAANAADNALDNAVNTVENAAEDVGNAAENTTNAVTN